MTVDLFIRLDSLHLRIFEISDWGVHDAYLFAARRWYDLNSNGWKFQEKVVDT